MFLLFSHKLTPLQIKDAKETFGIEEFVYLPKSLQDIWSQFPPEVENLDDLLNPIKEFLSTNAKPQDIVLIQGDFGATFQMVSFAKTIKLTAVYSTNKRVAKEFIENDKLTKISEFVHKRFRKF